jgi:GNAT superfamily N-acetyltransferase
VRVVPLDPETATAADIAAVHEVLAAASAVDCPRDPVPVLDDIRARIRSRRDDRPRWHFVARDGETTVGWAALRLSLLDNTHLGMADVTVHPLHRRQGIGSTLLRTIVAMLTAEDRRVLFGETMAGTAGDDFCRALGAELAQVGRNSLLRMAEVDWADVETTAAAKHPGYRLEAWADRSPDELVDGYATAKNAMNDAPHDGVEFTEFVYTADIIRQDEAAARARGEARVVVAVHEATGAVAALTEVLVPGVPMWSYQEDTAVVPEHRGSGLGLWIKADMLVRLRAERPDITALLTGNAASNAHMLRINDRLGYRLWSTTHGWQADGAELAARLG